MADGTPVETVTPREFVLVVVSFFLVLTLLTVRGMPASYDPCSSTAHPMSANFTRYNDSVIVTWMGGNDATFVENLSVTVNNETYGVYPVPYACERLTIVNSAEPVYIGVYGFDKAAKIYREIWSEQV